MYLRSILVYNNQKGYDMTLKNHYETSFNKIAQEAQDKLGVKVILNKKAEESFWLPSANTIVISGKTNWKRRVNFLLHEIFLVNMKMTNEFCLDKKFPH